MSNIEQFGAVNSITLEPQLSTRSKFDASTAPAIPRTILVVEDSAALLDLVETILKEAGFTVLTARTTGDAIGFAGHTKTIDLLLSDVVMPDLSGPDLALKLKKCWPEMRVILMSGYPGGEILVLNYGWHFIRKPFVPVQLVAKINEVLVSDTRDQGTDHFDTNK
jgi:DNA-binding response OmpR family regulator